jgi:hypothetical protein
MPEENIQQRFQRLVTKDLGAVGVVDVQLLPPFLAERAALALELVRSHLDSYVARGNLSVDRSSIHVDVFGGAQAEAFAHSPDGDHFVGASLGMMSAIDRIWNALLSVPEAFPAIGDCSSSTTGVTLPAAPLSMERPPASLQELVESLEAMSEAERPSCPVRAQFAAEMSAVTLTFCLLHEAGHLLGGHTRLPRCPHASGRICELNSYGQDATIGSHLQIDASYGLELLADHYAFETLLLKLQRSSFVRPLSNSSLGGAWWEKTGGDASPSDSALAIGSAASGCLFLLFYLAGTRASETHPHPFYRISWLLLQEAHLIKPEDGGVLNTDVAWNAVSEVWGAFQKLGLPTMPVPHGAAFNKELNRLLIIVHDLRVELEPFSWDFAYMNRHETTGVQSGSLRDELANRTT